MIAVNGNILVKVEKENEERVTESGLFIPVTSEEGAILKGVVEHASRSPLASGDLRDSLVRTDDTIWFPAFKASRITVDGKTLYVVPEAAVLMVK